MALRHRAQGVGRPGGSDDDGLDGFTLATDGRQALLQVFRALPVRRHHQPDTRKGSRTHRLCPSSARPAADCICRATPNRVPGVVDTAGARQKRLRSEQRRRACAGKVLRRSILSGAFLFPREKPSVIFTCGTPRNYGEDSPSCSPLSASSASATSASPPLPLSPPTASTSSVSTSTPPRSNSSTPAVPLRRTGSGGGRQRGCGHGPTAGDRRARARRRLHRRRPHAAPGGPYGGPVVRARRGGVGGDGAQGG